MRLALLVAVLAAYACGHETGNIPVPGVYDVTSTVTGMKADPPSTTCTSNTPEVSQMLVEISRESNGYTLYLCDTQANTCDQKIAFLQSQDGHVFTVHLSAGPWAEDITVDLSYETNGGTTTVSGTGTTVLTMPGYAPGSCTESTDLDGTKR